MDTLTRHSGGGDLLARAPECRHRRAVTGDGGPGVLPMAQSALPKSHRCVRRAAHHPSFPETLFFFCARCFIRAPPIFLVTGHLSRGVRYNCASSRVVFRFPA